MALQKNGAMAAERAVIVQIVHVEEDLCEPLKARRAAPASKRKKLAA